MSRGALDNSARLVDSNDHHQGSGAGNDNPLQKQAGKELSSPNNGAGTAADTATNWARTNPTADKSPSSIDLTTKSLYAALTSLTLSGFSKPDATAPGAVHPSDNATGRTGEAGRDGGTAPTEHEKILIKYFKPIEIKIGGILDGSSTTGPTDLQEAKEHFLKVFGEHGGKTETARKYINKLIQDNHELAEYGREHHEKIHYISDNKLAACINEFSKVCETKRTGTAAQLTDAEVNRKLLHTIRLIGDPNQYINQGQIGSCALHSSLHYEVVKAPQEVARVAGKILTTGNYRGVFTKRDMSAEAGEDDVNHMLGTAQLRCTYKQQHLTSGYGGTDTDAQAAGIKRFTRGHAHAVFGDNRTKSNGANLTYWPGHALVKVIDARRVNGKLELMMKTDNTWDGYADGAWKKV